MNGFLPFEKTFMKKIVKTLLAFGLLSLMAFSPRGWAYVDQLQAPADEVWLAVHQTAVPLGIKKENEAKRELETKWKEDRVVRKDKLSRGIFKQSYKRRTRYKIFLTETDGLSEVSIKAKYQFKNPDAGINGLWKTFKPDSEDKEMERALFFQILRRVEENKRKFLEGTKNK